MKANSEEQIVQELLEFAVDTRYLDIPKDVIDFTKVLTLKTVGGMVVGSAKPAGRKMAKIIKDRNLRDEVGVMGCGFKTALWESIFLHAFFAHASELEDNRMTAWGDTRWGGSWDITVIPLVFPLAEKLKLSGKSLLETIAVGLEVHSRTLLYSADDLGLGFIPGAAGPAIAAAKAMGLDMKETANTLGLATANVPLAHFNFGTDAHYLESSMHSLQGIMAAEMAKEGMTGNSRLIHYLRNVLGPKRVVPEVMVKDLGEKWLFAETVIKKYPVCFLTHLHIDTMLDLKKEHNISFDDVESIKIDICPVSQVCNRPEPQTAEDLQFSFQNVLSAALLDGDVNLYHVSEEAVDNPRYKEARSKVKVVCHDDWTREITEATIGIPTGLVVTMKNGEKYSKERKTIRGSQYEPLTMEQIKELYAKFTHGILSEEHIKKTSDLISNMEELSDVQELIDILVYRHRI